MHMTDYREDPVLRLVSVSKTFNCGGLLLGKRVVRALDNVSLEVARGERLCIIGESGAGKTTLCKLVLGLLKPTSGRIIVCGVDLSQASSKELRRVRASVSYIPQHPESSLDPRWRIIDSLIEPLRLTGSADPRIALEAARSVGLREEVLYRYPSQVSGGELQRAVIARALVKKPSLLVADEPTSMLDPSTQALVMRTILDMQSRNGFALLLVTHDVSLARAVCDRIAVIARGMIIEIAETNELLENPLHPYTRWFIGAEEPPLGAWDENAPGCPFHKSCPHPTSLCSRVKPVLKNVGKNHYVSCHVFQSTRS